MSKNLVSLTIEVPKKLAEHLTLLEKNSGKTKGYFIQEVFERDWQAVEDLQTAMNFLKSEGKTATNEELGIYWMVQIYQERYKEFREKGKVTFN